MYTFGSNDVFSDLVKDVYGTRDPARDGGHLSSFYHECDEVKQQMWDELCYQLEENTKAEKLFEKECIEKFEARIKDVMGLGAIDRLTAIRWIIGPEKFYHIQDVEHFVWEQGILFTPYGKKLIKEIEAVVEYEEMV
jgi:hypothetical protein